MIKKNLTKTILYAFLIGIIFGIFLNTLESHFSLFYKIIIEILDIGGTIFLSILKMLVVPIVFVSIICGIGGIGDFSSLGRIGIKTICIYLLTTSVAILLSMIVYEQLINWLSGRVVMQRPAKPSTPVRFRP